MPHPATQTPISLADLASGPLLDRAYDWLRHRRRDYPAAADVWTFRRRWPEEKGRLQADLLARRFRFGLLRRITRQDGSEVDLWNPRDALVLKCLAWLLGERLPLSERCCHLQGHGGAKAAVRAVRRRLKPGGFVLKTDVRSYYASTRYGPLGITASSSKPSTPHKHADIREPFRPHATPCAPYVHISYVHPATIHYSN